MTSNAKSTVFSTPAAIPLNKLLQVESLELMSGLTETNAPHFGLQAKCVNCAELRKHIYLNTLTHTCARARTRSLQNSSACSLIYASNDLHYPEVQRIQTPTGLPPANYPPTYVQKCAERPTGISIMLIQQ